MPTTYKTFSDLLIDLVVQQFIDYYGVSQFVSAARGRGHLSKEESAQLDAWAVEFVPRYLRETMDASDLMLQELVAQGTPDFFIMRVLAATGFYED